EERSRNTAVAFFFKIKVKKILMDKITINIIVFMGGKGLLVMETENPIASNIPNQVNLLAVPPGNYHG
ncbi:hypothetical protein, partial [Staphylococcus aureus]|uniref:hypothetical protein n=1 Tax=Staphylococcus aureus TaxID=1280 RepID=UPI00301D67A0